MRTAKVLIVDDDPLFRRSMRKVLVSEGYEVTEASTGQKALEMLRHVPQDLMLLDMVLPGMSGLDTCRAVRAFSDVPVIAVSARNLEREKIVALDVGADDFVTKPFSLPELLARVRAALRRMPLAEGGPEVLHLGDLEVNFAIRRVVAGGRQIRLTSKEADLLQCLAAHPNTCLLHGELLQTIWGPESSNELIHLRVLVARLRKKIEPDPRHPRYIVLEHALGYRLLLTPPESREP